MPERVIAFDLETTGTRWEEARIVELALVELDTDLGELGVWSRRVHPGVPIPEEAREVHGIGDADVADLPRFTTHASRVQRLVEDAVLVAYNAKFDVNILHHELVRHGQPGFTEHPHVVDPWRLFREELNHNAYRLEDAVRVYCKREHVDAHGALADARATVEVLRAQRSLHPDRAADLQELAVDENVLLHDVEWLEPGQRFYRDPDGEVRFNFGKHEDDPATAHPSYLSWMLGADFDPVTKRVVQDLLDPA